MPAFNLVCNIWYGPGLIPPAGLPDLVVACQLAWDASGQRMVLPRATSTAPVHFMCLRLPALTDVRMFPGQANPDVAEVPAGSGRYYQVFAVDDVAKGFINEYRQAMIVPALFPTPIP